MKIRCFIASAALLPCAWGSATAQSPQFKPPAPLPADSSAPVVVFNFESPIGEGVADEPRLIIYADGRAIASAPESNGGQVTGKIPPRELNELLRALIVEHQLLQCDSAHLSKEIRAARLERRRPEPDQSAATTVIRIQTADSAHEVRCHALGLTASQFPDLEHVQSLMACEQDLENVAAIIRAGGYERVHHLLSAANQRLQLEAPQASQLTCRELSLVDVRPDGSRYLQFARPPSADGLKPVGGIVVVSVHQRPGEPPEITITADES